MNTLPLASASPFYRVTVKGIVKDDQDRLLVLKHQEGHYEMPGGGWEHGETLEQCLKREMQEEIGVLPTQVGPILFTYTTPSIYGYMTLRIAVAAQLIQDTPSRFACGDGIVDAAFLPREAFLKLPFAQDEAGIQACTSQIWPN